MALDGTLVWEVRTGGDDANGGGYSSDDGGTDYSQQVAAQLSLTDLATSGIGVTTLTSITGGFTSAMIDNIIQIVSGTNVTAGFYRITGYTNTNTVTLDRAPDDGVGGISAGVGKVGGSLATPGKAAEAATVSGQEIWVASGTYTLTTTTPGSSGPVVLTPDKAIVLEGYNAAGSRGDRTATPVIDVGAQGACDLVTVSPSFNGEIAWVINIKCDGQDTANVNGFVRVGSFQSLFYLCESVDCNYGFLKAGHYIRCTADSCVTGFKDVLWATGSVAKNCSGDGFITLGSGKPAALTHCVAHDNGGEGFRLNYHCAAYGCTAYNNTGDGFYHNFDMVSAIACVAVGNGGYGFNNTAYADVVFANNAGWNNTSGNFRTTPVRDIGLVALSGDPFENAAGFDFRPDNTAGEGAALRAAGIGPLSQTNNTDIGAVQHADPVGGGGGLLTHPGMSGGMRG